MNKLLRIKPKRIEDEHMIIQICYLLYKFLFYLFLILFIKIYFMMGILDILRYICIIYSDIHTIQNYASRNKQSTARTTLSSSC
jgi:hypothetical protein